LYNKQIAPITVKNYLDKRNDELTKELEDLGVLDGLKNSTHNGKYYRKTMNELVATIIEYI
jgi:hypothetical protein